MPCLRAATLNPARKATPWRAAVLQYKVSSSHHQDTEDTRLSNILAVHHSSHATLPPILNREAVPDSCHRNKTSIHHNSDLDSKEHLVDKVLQDRVHKAVLLSVDIRHRADLKVQEGLRADHRVQEDPKADLKIQEVPRVDLKEDHVDTLHSNVKADLLHSREDLLNSSRDHQLSSNNNEMLPGNILD